jgi:hypothetical protein
LIKFPDSLFSAGRQHQRRLLILQFTSELPRLTHYCEDNPV